MTDPVERRLREADPARGQNRSAVTSADPLIREMMEATMTTPVQEREAPSPARAPRRLLGLLVAAALALVVGGAAVTVLGDDEPAPGPGAPMTLTLPVEDAAAICAPYSVDFLATLPVAFSGEVVSREGDRVVLTVDRWYRGGDAARVELTSSDATVALLGGMRFREGGRYLVSADTRDTVSTCGYSAEWSTSMAQDYRSAFGG